jgi:hypothetical protein
MVNRGLAELFTENLENLIQKKNGIFSTAEA